MKLHFTSFLLGSMSAILVLMVGLLLTSGGRKTLQLWTQSHPLSHHQEFGIIPVSPDIVQHQQKDHTAPKLTPRRAPIFPEHVEALRNSKMHDNPGKWTDSEPSRPYKIGLREIPCDNAEASRFVAQGVHQMRLSYDSGQADVSFLEPAYYFRAAMAKDPKCLTAALNWATLVVGRPALRLEPPEWEKPPQHLKTASDQGAPISMAVFDVGYDFAHDGDRIASVQLLVEVEALLKSFAAHANAVLEGRRHLWIGIVQELIGKGAEAQSSYKTAIRVDPPVLNEMFHPTYYRHLRLIQSAVDTKEAFIRKGLLQILCFYEFSPAFGAFAKLALEEARGFVEAWQIHVKGPFLPPYVHIVASRMYRYLIDVGILHGVTLYRGAASFESNGDVFNTFINVRLQEFVTRLSGIPVRATYGYTAGYIGGDVLKPHTDRKACEFTLTILLSGYPHYSFCPLYTQHKPWKIDRNWIGRYEENTIVYSDVHELLPRPNDALILRGRAKPHFRPSLANHTSCTTLLAHFVESTAPPDV